MSGALDLEEIAARVAGAAAPGEQVEAYVVRTRETDIEMYDGEVESLTTAGVEGIGIRVISSHRQGYASAGSLDPAVVDETLQEARDNAAFGEPDEWYALATPDDVAGVDVAVLDLWRDELLQVPTDDKVRIALELEAATKARDARVRGVESAGYGDGIAEVAIANSLGVRASTRRTSCSAYAYAIADDGAGAQTGYGFAAGRSLAELDLDAIPRDAVDRACRLLGAKQVPGRRIPVVLDPLVTRSLLGVLSPAFSGEAVLKGRSLFAGREGEKVASPTVELVDDPTDPRAYGASTHDGEGVPTRRNVLVADGVLQGFLHNVYTGRRAGPGTTGSAVRGGYGSPPGVGARALALRPGFAHARGADGVGSGGALRAVGERPALGHEPDQRRLLRGRRRAHGASRRVRRAGARGDDRVDPATDAPRPRRGRERPDLPAGRGRGCDRVDRRDGDEWSVTMAPTHITSTTRVEAAGTPPKIIEEVVGRVNTGTEQLSVAHMRSPAGWEEPGQTPEFDEYTYVIAGTLRVKHRGGEFDVHAGQAVIAHAGEWVQYSTPDGAEYVAVCLPAFAPGIVHRDE
ncbi:MAG: hypothetical protein KatS3mg010_0105 [Acidimicrobiia bacterium]|nr:MAG: hypothetical protein KatS3mg010_0105 [Acidimicrobiia bacterium]